MIQSIAKFDDLPVVALPSRAMSLDGFRAWALSDDFPERGRISFIDNYLLIDMSPEELETHNKVKEVVCRGIGNM